LDRVVSRENRAILVSVVVTVFVEVPAVLVRWASPVPRENQES